MEATPRFEPGNNGFADQCLTTWLCRHMMSEVSFGLYKTAFAVFYPLARVAGFEPANDGIRIRCLTAWRYPNDNVVGWMVGFEPTYTGATTLGLNRLTTPTASAFHQCHYSFSNLPMSRDKKNWRPRTGSNRRPPA